MMMKTLTSGRRGSGDKHWRITTMMTVVFAAFALSLAAAADSHGFEVSIPITTVIVNAPAGSVIVLETVEVPAEFVGQSCSVLAVSANPDSVHPNNDLVVSSGGSSVTLPDVEGVSGGNVVASGTLQLGPDIVVSLVMGPDGVFSAGMDVVVDCTPEETTTTTTIPPEVLPTVVTTVPTEVLPTVVTTVPTEVAPTEALPSTLPFTGAESDELALIALALFGTGVLFLVATRSRRED
jgi:hypothetical protein